MLIAGTADHASKISGSLTIAERIANQKLAERARQLVAQIAGVDGSQARELLPQACGHLRWLIKDTNIDVLSSKKEAT